MNASEITSIFTKSANSQYESVLKDAWRRLREQEARAEVMAEKLTTIAETLGGTIRTSNWNSERVEIVVSGEVVCDSTIEYQSLSIDCGRNRNLLRKCKELGELKQSYANYSHTDENGIDWLVVTLKIVGMEGVVVTYLRESLPEDSCKIVENVVTEKRLVCSR